MAQAIDSADGLPVRRSALAVLSVTHLGGVTALAAGMEHTCALTTGGGMKCWGDNEGGQLGDGTTTDRNTPVDVSGLTSGVTALAASNAHTCALTAGGGVKCWGWNQNGQLGDGTTTNHSAPVDVTGLGNGITALATGVFHTCALSTAGGVKCWGWNEYGQLGDETTFWRSIPVDVTGLMSEVMALAVGDWHTCALTAGGGVKCWGRNASGELGDGLSINHSTPVDVAGLTSGVKALAVGLFHTCALTTGGGVKCWGWNEYGQLGDGTTTSHSTPVDVSELTNGVKALAAGVDHTCALTASGGVKCWGDNGSGQLGDGTSTNRSTPVNVIGLPNEVMAMTAGGFDTCALIAGGAMNCWGDNGYGQIGDGTTTHRYMPVDVIGLTNGVIAMTVGEYHNCALTAGKGVKCWGKNWSGQLGDGTTTQRSTPVDVSGLASGVTAMAAGDSHTCALTASGGMKCWGDNESGQLGDGTTTRRLTPVDVSGLTKGVMAVAAGGFDTCALVGSGRSKCWGDDSLGQLGLGTLAQSLTPVDVVASAPELSINYFDGQSGSFFTLTGEHFPPNSQAALSVNFLPFAGTVTVNASGSFISFINSTAADEGHYLVIAFVGGKPAASAWFTLVSSAPLRPPEGGGQTLVVPPGLGKVLHKILLSHVAK